MSAQMISCCLMFNLYVSVHYTLMYGRVIAFWTLIFVSFMDTFYVISESVAESGCIFTFITEKYFTLMFSLFVVPQFFLLLASKIATLFITVYVFSLKVNIFLVIYKVYFFQGAVVTFVTVHSFICVNFSMSIKSCFTSTVFTIFTKLTIRTSFIIPVRFVVITATRT